MTKRRIFILLAVIIVLVLPFSVFAATSDSSAAKKVRGFFGIDTSKLSDQQKSDIKDYSTKMANLEKEFINKMVSNGTMTKEQGDAAIKKIDEALANSTANGFKFGMGKGFFDGKGPGKNAVDTSKLTSAQISDLTDTYKKMAEAAKAGLTKLVSDGLITQAQADTASKAIDDRLSKLGTNGPFFGIGGMEAYGMMGKMLMPDVSKLTDAQKADLKEISNKMAELQKELINKIVTYNLMTKEQGDAASKRIDALKDQGIEKGFAKGFGMERGKFGKRRMGGAPDTGSSASVPKKKFF